MKKPNRFIIQLTAVIAASSLLIAGCSASDNGSGGGQEVQDVTAAPAGDYNKKDRDAIKDGGTLTTAIYEIAEQQNVFHADASTATRALWRWYNPVMALYDETGKYTPNPDFLTKVSDEVVDGKTRVTYDIVEEATWNDGTPIDWKAFETTWIINRGDSEDFLASSTDGYELIASVSRGESDKQTIVEFEGTYPWWEGLFNDLAHPALADPANYNDYLNKVHPEWGAGPYIVENVDFNKGEASFIRNDKWWGDTGKLDKRTYRQMEDSAELNAYKNGEIDATAVGNKERYAAVKDKAGSTIRIATRPSTGLLTLNAQSPQLEDIKVREALATGLDRALLAQIRYNGIPFSEKLPGSFTLYPFQEGYQDNYSKVVQYDQDKAKSLLDEAGWAEGSDGIREKDGKKLSLRYVVVGESETSKALATAIQKIYKDIGVDIKVEQRPSADFSKITSTYDFDLFYMGFASSDPYGVAYFGQTYTSDSQLNRSRTGTAEFDEKIAELQKLPTQEEQIKRANELETEALALHGIIPLNNGADMIAVKDGLANYGAFGFAVVAPEDIGWEK